MVLTSGLTPGILQLLASASVQVFQEADRVGRESSRLQCPSDKDREPTEKLQSKDSLLKKNSRLGQLWSGPSTAIVLGHQPGKSAQEECSISSNTVWREHVWLPHWIVSLALWLSFASSRLWIAFLCWPSGTPGLFAWSDLLPDGIPPGTVSMDTTSV